MSHFHGEIEQRVRKLEERARHSEQRDTRIIIALVRLMTVLDNYRDPLATDTVEGVLAWFTTPEAERG